MIRPASFRPLLPALLAAVAISLPAASASDFTPFDVTCGAVVDKNVIIAPAPLWFFTAGAAVRSIDASFRANGSNLSRNFTPYSGRGDVGIYKLGDDTLRYDDGYVTRHDHPNFENRAAGGYVKSQDQVSSHPLGYEHDGIVNHTVAFHTDSYSYSQRNDNATGSDSDTGVGPFLQLGRQLSVCKAIDINLIASWSYISTDHSSGPLQAASLLGDQTIYRYQYDHLTNATLIQNLPGWVGGGHEFLLLEPADGPFLVPSTPGYRAPSASQSQGEHAELVYRALANSNLRVNLNEVAFGGEAGRNCGPVQLLFTGGFTLNVIDYDLSTQVAWYDNGGNRVSGYQTARDSGTPLKVGLYGGLLARCNLSKSGNLFLEGSGTYRWVDPIQASNGLTSVEIDPSSWEGRFGVGVRF